MKNIVPASLVIVCCSLLSPLCVQAADQPSKLKETTTLRAGGIDHIGLTVSKLEASTAFFEDLLGFKVVGRDKDYPAVFMNNGEVTITLWSIKDVDQAIAFNRQQNVGLHHLALKIDSFETLNALYERMKETPGVKIEFAPELAYGGPAKHMMVREPSGNRLELVHRP